MRYVMSVIVLLLGILSCDKATSPIVNTEPAIDSVSWSINITAANYHNDSLSANASASLSASLLGVVDGQVNGFNKAKFQNVDIRSMNGHITYADTLGHFSFAGKQKLLEGYEYIEVNPTMQTGFAAKPAKITLYVNINALQ